MLQAWQKRTPHHCSSKASSVCYPAPSSTGILRCSNGILSGKRKFRVWHSGVNFPATYYCKLPKRDSLAWCRLTAAVVCFGAKLTAYPPCASAVLDKSA